MSDCAFGPVEQDGARYCHQHCSFMECWHENRSRCPRALEISIDPSLRSDSAPRGESAGPGPSPTGGDVCGSGPASKNVP